MKRILIVLGVVVACAGCEPIIDLNREEPDVRGQLDEAGLPLKEETLFEPTLVGPDGPVTK